MSTLVSLWRVLLGAVAAAAAILILAVPAKAHDPIFLTEDQDRPESGPYLPDGTISFAIYGSILAPDETRGFEFDLRDGDDLYLSLLIPDLEPETALPEEQLPTLTLIEPDGTVRPIATTIRTPFADPFSGTDYLTLFETDEAAMGGRYQIIVTGNAPSRFVVAVGTREEFFTPTERSGDRPSSFPGIAAPLNEWYTTPADGSAPVNVTDRDEVDVDVDLIEEELAKLEDEAEPTASEQATNNSAEASGVDSADDEGGGLSTTWIAPVVAAVATIAGGAVYARRRAA